MRLNVEMQRLRTWIRDEAKHTHSVIGKLSTTDPLLASDLRWQWTGQEIINNRHLQMLDMIKKLPGFLGKTGIGLRDSTSLFLEFILIKLKIHY